MTTAVRSLSRSRNALWINAHIKAFNARLQQECLNENWFLSLEDALEKVETRRRYYNGERPHGALGNLTPKEFTRLVVVAG